MVIYSFFPLLSIFWNLGLMAGALAATLPHVRAGSSPLGIQEPGSLVTVEPGIRLDFFKPSTVLCVSLFWFFYYNQSKA